MGRCFVFIAIFVPKRTCMYISSSKNNQDSSASYPLSELLRCYMEENNISAKALCEILSIDRKTLPNILNGAEIKLGHAVRIMNLLNLSDEGLIKSYMSEMDKEDFVRIEKTKSVSFILEHFDLDGLKEAGVIKSTVKFDDVNESLCNFFGFKSIYEYNNVMLNSGTLFSKSRVSVNENREKKMQRFWVKCAADAFERINNPNEYDEVLLIEFMKRLKVYTQDTKDGFSKVLYVLYQLGVTVLVQPYMTKTKAFGISMIVNNKPCIVITDMGKRYHKLWLTLLHELYHVINDYEYLTRTKFHISNPEFEDLFVSESDADNFACSVMLPEKSLQIASKLIRFPYKVNELAKKIGIHSAMVYGVYLETLTKESASKEYPKYSKYLLESCIAIKSIVFDPVEQKSIESSVEKVKNQFNTLTA